MLKDQEYIICAAIHYDDGIKRPHPPRNLTTGIVMSGWRHGNCFVGLAAVFPDYEYNRSDKVVQGFLTSRGRFLNREEAGALAFEAGQIENPITCLFSEDIY